jgi:hypothetical protein
VNAREMFIVFLFASFYGKFNGTFGEFCEFCANVTTTPEPPRPEGGSRD